MRAAADSCVIVKWFKGGEDSQEEALRLRDEVLSGSLSLVISEWAYLEVARGLSKVGYSRDGVLKALEVLREMVELGFLDLVSVSSVLEQAMELIIELGLYASDAVTLASAIARRVDLVSEDRHLLRDHVREAASSRGIGIFSLKEFYGERPMKH